MIRSGLASLLRDFVDVLIPGEGPWPSASMVGVQGVLAMRLLEVQGEAGATSSSGRCLNVAGRWRLSMPRRRAEVVQQFEPADPAFFKLVRNAAYLAYYENPAVVRAMQGLGQPYQAMPAAKGYPLPAFDLERGPAAASARSRHQDRGREAARSERAGEGEHGTRTTLPTF